MKIYFFVFALFVALSTSRSSVSAAQSKDPLKFILGEGNLGTWRGGVLSASAQAPGPASESTLVLAANRTKRPDILHGFRRYRGGWDFDNKHYWASVGFTGAVGFILAVLWFVSFGLALVVHHFCGWRIKFKGKGSHLSQRICLILLLVFTCAAAVGCILLSVGQGEFHGEAIHTLKYVVNQSDYTVQTLRNVTQYLLLAKTINVAQVFVPSDVKDEIDKLNADLITAADTLNQKTSDNSGKIQRVFNAVRSSLITVAALMLVLSLLGLFLSILGHKHAIHIFVVSGWLLVAVTFILCGIFVILNNAISDTCMAMGEWVDNPHAETALSNILPCVDQRTTNQTLIQSKEVVTDIVNVVNQYIYTYANINPPPQANSYYYNQSGPWMPPLCYPYDKQLQVRQCDPFEVSMGNASLVWQNFACTVSASGLCTSVGRVTPDMYEQLVAAVNISIALQLYAPPLLSLQDCNFVRDTFRNITSDYCPPLEHHLRMVNAGLALISVGVMLCLALWLLYANRPQREEVFAKLSLRIKSSCSYKNSCKNNSNADVPSRSTTPSGA
ncbi:Keratin-associated protein like [Actinidia chinensis var. chinensis]|uniref:Keratin-associated protein like n=1 Tax=Actinidia chinensis var. chinensis TaxID=1590841 RepID=A0A2R6R241_ACTCC|nr:Keratin-associated protein like [Actinidia chinensis var. chinensis]